MAFHPFKHFRKHQKVYLAALTILTMIIFVAQFGAGDPFTRLQQWIGMAVSHGDPVIELYGKTIRTDDLDRLQWRRQLASDFLISGSAFNPMQRMGTPLEKSFFDIQNKFGQRKDVNDLPTPMQTTLSQVFIALFSPPEVAQKQLQDIQKQLGYPEVQSNPEQYRALDTLATILAFRAWVADPNKKPKEYYFGGTPRTEDLLDFMIWKHEADRLGIVLTQADVCREVNRAWGHGDYLQPDGKFERNEWVSLFFKENSRIHANMRERDLLSALTDEFRVALAKEAVLGSAPGVRSYRDAVDHIHHSPSVATPDEFYKYFVEQRTELSLKMLSLPVKDFVSKVKAQPTEADLRNLYSRYQNDEPSPTRRQPGFKEPRRVKLEYVRYRLDGPFAQQLASKMMALLPVLRIGQTAMPYAGGGGFAWAAHLAAQPDVEMAVRALYDDYREQERRRSAVRYDADDHFRFGLGLNFQDWRSTERQAAVATVGQLLGNAASGASPIAAPISWLAGEVADERATLTSFASMVLAGDSSTPLAAMMLPQRYLYVTQPLEGVHDELLARFRTTLAKKLMEKHIANLRKDLEKELDRALSSHSEEQLNAFLKKAIPEYGLEDFHAMTESQTRQEILDHPDKALRDLQAAYNATKDNPFRGPVRPDFADALMFKPEDGMPRETIHRSWQFTSPDGSDEVWLYWRSVDQAARVRPFQEIRAEVKDAWYLEQARKLARDRAQQINEELKKQNLAPDAAAQFLTEQKPGRVFTLTRVAHLTAPMFNLPTGALVDPKYSPYQPPKEDVPYPPANFVTELHKLKKRGDSRVVADQPVRHFYVALLMENPQLPERSEFYKAYNLVNLDKRDEMKKPEKSLWAQMMEDRERKYARSLMEQLRAEATKSLEGGEYVLKEEIRNRGESSSD